MNPCLTLVLFPSVQDKTSWLLISYLSGRCENSHQERSLRFPRADLTVLSIKHLHSLIFIQLDSKCIILLSKADLEFS